jgi:hypothetical protein
MSEGDVDIEGAADAGDTLIGANVGKRSIGGLAMRAKVEGHQNNTNSSRNKHD